MIQEVSAFRLSPQQERVWLLQQGGERPVYDSRCIVLIEGDLDSSVLRQAWSVLADRHEILRTDLRLLPGLKRPVQVADGTGAVWLEDRDLRHLAAAAQECEMDSSLAEPADASATGTLRLLHLGERRHALLVRLSAYLCDAAGLGNLVRELGYCYGALRGGHLPQDEPVQYNVVAEWFNELLESPDTEVGKKYWRSRSLSLLPELRLPFEHPATVPGFLPRVLVCPLAAERVAGLEGLAAEQEVSLAALLLTAWSALLARLSGQPKLVVGVACSGRTDEELELAVGPFARYLPIDWEMTAGSSFSAAARSVLASLEEAWQWQECFSWDGLERLAVAQPGTSPFFPFAFDSLELPGKLEVGAMTFTLDRQLTCSDRFVLKLSCVRRPAGLTLELHYDAGRLDGGEAERVAQQLETLLDSALRAPDAELADLEVVGSAERRRLLAEYNDTPAALELDRCLHELFEAQVTRTPDRIAVACDGREVTYAELNARANRLARHLRTQGVETDGLVGICLERSPEMVVALLAVLKAGGAYVPLDPEYPLERLAHMLSDAAPRVLLTQAGVAGDLRRHAPVVIDLARDDCAGPEETAGESPENLGPYSAPDNLAYVIYTSGSTGLPKGVMVRHRSIANRLLWMLRKFPLGVDDRVLQKTPFSFDASIWEFFTPLFSGARLVLASPGGHQDSAYLVRATAAEKITTLQLVPSLLRVFLAEPGVTACRSLRRVFCGGEALPADLVARFYEILDAELHNLYGPTEVAIDATSWSCLRHDPQVPVPIGRPIDNVQVFLLDARGGLAPEGVPGELYVGGTGLARGYLARPHLTAERFVPHFAPVETGGRLYRTGDLARHRGDGAIEFLGRIDHQVKLRGFRIELGEVEAGLRRHPGVQESVVMVRGDGQGGQRLVAYVVPRHPAAAGTDGENLYRLPNGLTVAHLNRGETDWLYHEVFAERSYLQRGLTLADGDCVFDVGANIGLFTLFVHHTVRNARVFAFEPSPPTFACLRANAEMHGLDVELFDCGLSDVAREAEFTFYPQVSASSGLYADADADARVTRRFLANQDARLAEYADDLMEGRFASQVFTRPLRRLSDVLRERGVERIDYLKLDVEKSELDVLWGIGDEDWPRIRQIAMEVHDTDGRLAHIVGLLCDRGFAVEVDQLDLLADTGLFNLYAVHPQRAEDLRQRAAMAAGMPALIDPAEPATPDRLRDFLSIRLPPYMVPSLFVLLEHLPRTPSGKVDRAALPDPEQTRGGARTAYVAPRNPLEQELHDIWKELLGIERVGVDDNFFDLGGHSLLATQIISRLRSQFHVEVPLRRIFEAPTIAGLAASLAAGSETELAAAVPPLVAVPHDRDLPLSYGQQRLWFLDQLVGGAFYNIPVAYRLTGALDAAVLERSLNEIVRRHEVLRTSFPAVDGQPVAVVAAALTVPLPVVDLSALAAPARAAELRQQVGEEAGRPFRLDRAPLLRVTLLRLADQDQVLVVNVHHIVFDGWSTGIFFGELAELYKAFTAGAPSPLPELPLQYVDFALWQREWLHGDVLAGQLAYWRQRLTDAPAVIELPLDRPRPPIQAFNGASLDAVLPCELATGLRELSQAAGATMFMALLAAFQALLHRYSGQPRIVVGTPIANRNRAEVEGLIGLFVNTLALATDVDGELSFHALLERVREVSLGAYAHQDMPFEQLVEAVEPQRNLAHQPLFQVMFAFQNLPAPVLDLPALGVGVIAQREETAKFDLNLLFEEHGPAIGGTLNYNVDLFDGTTAVRLLHHLETLLRGIRRDPGRRLGELELLAPGERHQLVAGWNDTVRQVAGDLALHQLFAVRAARQPTAPAAFFGDRRISYGELDAEANRLAHHLRQLGVCRGSLVAVLMDRSLEMLPALLGILKAGAAYVPLEPSFPAARLEWILGAFEIPYAITQSAHLGLLGGLALPRLAHVVCLDPAGSPAAAVAGGPAPGWQVHGTVHLAAQPATAPAVDVRGDDIAYIIFTSGSTGTPKGVVVCHRPVVNLIDWVNREFAIGPADRVLFITSLCFDLSVYDVFGLLAAGGSIRIASAVDLEEPKRLLRRLCDEPITFWDSAPAALQQLAPLFAEASSWPGRDRLRLVFLSGDWIPVTLPDRVRELFSATRVIGLGGATEATVWSNFFPIGDVPPQWVSIPYGRPIQNACYLVLDPGLAPCPIGVAGDLFIGGDCLCTGYAGDPVQTAERFIPDPYGPPAGGRLYRTGDRARWRGDASLQFLGRLDHQVKIRGFRIELGEVEAVLAQHPAVGEVVVLAREDQPGDKRLVAYLAVRPQVERPAPGELRSFVLERLPDYMVPAAFVFLETFPVTANGKVDRKALPAPARTRTGAERVSKPRDTLELKMVQDWEEVLNIHPVGVLDNFFELGGNSLIAVRLMARLQKAVGREVPLATLFQSPTISSLADALRNNSVALPVSPLVPIQPHGSRPPLFLVHSLGGEVLSYYDLARHLGPEQPVYGLQAPPLAEVGDREIVVEEAAAEYVAALRAVQPMSPYFLGGYSYGAVVAFEMAQQLRRAGESVGLVALLDGYSPIIRQQGPMLEDVIYLATLARETARMSGSSIHLPHEEVQRLPRDLAIDHILVTLKAASLLPPEIDRAWIDRFLQGARRREESLRRYRPQVYEGQLTLFRSTELDDENLKAVRETGIDILSDPARGWDRLSTEPLAIHTLRCHHETLLLAPHVEVLAEMLRALLAEPRSQREEEADGDVVARI